MVTGSNDLSVRVFERCLACSAVSYVDLAQWNLAPKVQKGHTLLKYTVPAFEGQVLFQLLILITRFKNLNISP